MIYWQRFGAAVTGWFPTLRTAIATLISVSTSWVAHLRSSRSFIAVREQGNMPRKAALPGEEAQHRDVHQ